MASSSRLFQKTRNNFKPPKNRPYITHPPLPYEKRGSLNCTTCGVQLTIKHIFTKCKNNQQERMETLGATHLYEILSLEPTATQKLFIFLKKSTLFKEI
ncbi:putative RNA-directed DNA polymerase [Aphis craccivora]|uniref:Putative RNA-directed DNA polymerase n=1 Tax=Aphis craccivora TaxID=307492 RepID=A0A6G0YS21_APHCR|nr:putative RNA-directed DNA polymerase [Aphis craccivora]